MRDEDITWKIATFSLLSSIAGGLIGGLPAVLANEEQKAKQAEYKDVLVKDLANKGDVKHSSNCKMSVTNDAVVFVCKGEQ